MEDHETRRKIIREWMALPKDKRQTEEQVAAFAKNAAQQNKLHRRDPSLKFRRDPYQKLMGWLLPRAGKSKAIISAERSVTRRPTFGLLRRSQLLSQINVARLK